MVEQLDSSLLGGPDDRGFVVDPQGIIGSRCVTVEMLLLHIGLKTLHLMGMLPTMMEY
jgi:hypothetical protein